MNNNRIIIRKKLVILVNKIKPACTTSFYIYVAGHIEYRAILKLPRTYWNVLSNQAFLKRPGLSGSVLNCPKIFSGHIKMSWNIFRTYQNRQNERDCEFLMLYQEHCKCNFILIMVQAHFISFMTPVVAYLSTSFTLAVISHTSFCTTTL